MQLLRILTLISVFILAGYFAVQHFSIRSACGPAIGLYFQLTNDGKPIPAVEIEEVRYEFREKYAYEDLEKTEGLTPASPPLDSEPGWRLFGPFSVWDRKKTTPQYRSLLIKAELKNGKKVSLCYPIISDTALSGQILLDISDDQNEFQARP